ncbi:MAG: ATP-binding protein [Sandaracinaceae bacterium]
MLSPLATLLFTWAAVYSYAGVYFCMLHARRPTHREYLGFGLLCFGLATWSAGAAIGSDARDPSVLSGAIQIEYIGGFVTVVYFVDFATQLVGREAPRLVRAAYAFGYVGLVATASGFLLVPSARFSGGLRDLSGYAEPVFTLPGAVLVAGALFFAAWSVWTLARGREEHPDLRVVVWAAAVAVGAAVYDSLLRFTGGDGPFLLEHVALLPILTVVWVLLRRFVRAADQLGERTDELRRSYSELRVVQEELVRKEQLAAVGELSAVIAHEVRNPLAIIKNAVSSLRRPSLRDADRGVLLGILDEEVDRLNRLVRDLLAYARPVEPKGRAVDLVTIAREAIDKALSSHPRPDAIEVQIDADGPTDMHGDPDLLRQALTNIADNAAQAMPDGGALRVRLRPRSGRVPSVILEFQDTGAGMDALVRAKALDPFFTTRPAGTGLGLAIVDRVVRNHGGEVSIESEAKVGTTVRITLPRERPSSVPPPPEGL